MSRKPAFGFYEFFAGGGMARAGLGADWACLFANDFDPLKTRTYAENWPGEDLRSGDVFALAGHDLPGRADLAWASSPCQDFSLAGARAGLGGGRSSAFFGFWSLMRSLNAEGRAPRLIAIENVVGLLTSRGGADFAALCAALAEEGYRFGALEIDAARFVPQSRPRVIVLATREGCAGHEGPSPYHTPAVRAAHAGLPRPLKEAWVWWRMEAPPARNTDLSALLEPDAAVAWRSDAETATLLGQMDERHRARVMAAAGSGSRAVGAVFRRMRAGVQRAEVRFDGLAGCVRTPGGGSSRQLILVADGGRVRTRWLTAREGARLMGLSDEYRLPPSQSAALKVIGDGVAVPVVRALAAQLIEPLLLRPQPAVAAE
jgi:DNA (cytosine-5)-methyltransferase 1